MNQKQMKYLNTRLELYRLEKQEVENPKNYQEY